MTGLCASLCDARTCHHQIEVEHKLCGRQDVAGGASQEESVARRSWPASQSTMIAFGRFAPMLVSDESMTRRPSGPAASKGMPAPRCTRPKPRKLSGSLIFHPLQPPRLFAVVLLHTYVSLFSTKLASDLKQRMQVARKQGSREWLGGGDANRERQKRACGRGAWRGAATKKRLIYTTFRSRLFDPPTSPLSSQTAAYSHLSSPVFLLPANSPLFSACSH